MYILAFYHEDQYLKYFGFEGLPPTLSLFLFARALRVIGTTFIVFGILSSSLDYFTLLRNKFDVTVRFKYPIIMLISAVVIYIGLLFPSTSYDLIGLIVVVIASVVANLGAILYRTRRFGLSYRQERLIFFFREQDRHMSFPRTIAGDEASDDAVVNRRVHRLLVALLFVLLAMLTSISGVQEASRERRLSVAKKQNTWFVVRAYETEIYLIRLDKELHPIEWKIIARSALPTFKLTRSRPMKILQPR